MQSINMSLCTFGIYIHWLYSTVARYTKDSSSVVDKGVGGNRCSLPRAPKQCSTHSNTHPSFYRVSFSLYFVDFKSACFFAAQTQIQCTHLTCLLYSPLARAQYVILFDLKLLNKDSNLQVYMYCMYAQKEASETPRTHFRTCKTSWGLGP